MKKPSVSQSLKSQTEDLPPLNVIVDDALAIAGGNEDDEALIAGALMFLASEKLARTAGRGRCLQELRQITGFIETAQPVRPWKP